MPTTPTPPSATSLPDPSRFVSLRVKFGVFLSLIIIATCSALSWYFVQNKRDSMTAQLKNLGSILTASVAYNPRLRFAMITEDQPALSEFIDGVMAVDDVVYVVISSPDGHTLIARSKGRLANAETRTRHASSPLYPDLSVAAVSLKTRPSEPQLTYLMASEQNNHAAPYPATAQARWSDATQHERLYDFALVVARPAEREGRPETLNLERTDTLLRGTPQRQEAGKVIGLIQVGLTEAYLNHALLETIRTIAQLTLFIILGGIIAAMLLTNRIITPLRSLAGVARRVTGGDLTANAVPTTRDEIGQLTWLFNNMTQSLKERDEAISSNLLTISRQVRQLTTLNQASVTIASTLELEPLMAAVLQLLTDNLGFARIILVLYNTEEQQARLVCGTGFSEALIARLKNTAIPIQEGGGLASDMLLRGKPLLVTNIDSIADQVHPPNLDVIREVGVRSFVMAPLRHQQRILGYLAGDRGDQICTQEDLDLLVTVASHVAVAIDNARAYLDLEQLTDSLERRVQERTQALQSANERLKELDKLKSAFVSIVSHELRTPMTAIRGYVDNMLDGLAGSLTEKQAHYLHRVKFNADRLTHMIAELLDLSRIEAGRVELNISEVNLRALLADVVDEFQRPARERGVAIETHLDTCLPHVQGDRDKLHQVFTNLVGNAMKFTPSKGVITIEIASEGPREVRFTVSDTGSGIPQDELPRIFEKFFRGGSVPPEARGAGLGLAIVRTLIELHGGRVWVESQVGVGSRFSLSLPVVATPPADSKTVTSKPPPI